MSISDSPAVDAVLEHSRLMAQSNLDDLGDQAVHERSRDLVVQLELLLAAAQAVANGLAESSWDLETILPGIFHPALPYRRVNNLARQASELTLKIGEFNRHY